MAVLKTALLFVTTALAEIVGCFLPYLWLRRHGPIWLLLPAAASLALFVWLLTLHPRPPPAGCTRLWQCVRGDRLGMAAGGRWRETVGLRLDRSGGGLMRDGDHRPGLG